MGREPWRSSSLELTFCLRSLSSGGSRFVIVKFDLAPEKRKGMFATALAAA